MDNSRTVQLYTIGFAKKNAEEFFDKLRQAQIKTLIDVRLNNVSQLAGFTKKNDLRFFLNEICKINYKHIPELAPTKQILNDYKNKSIDWEEYEDLYIELIKSRNIRESLDPKELHCACLLCSEPLADNCHRRLAAEYLRDTALFKIKIHHL